MSLSILEKINNGMVGNQYLWRCESGTQCLVTTVERVELNDNGDVIIFSINSDDSITLNGLDTFLDSIAL